MLELKKLSAEATVSALEKAKQYRLLNEPDEAESICLDILAVEPTNQEALNTLFLALTDKFTDSGLKPSFEEAQKVISQMDSDFCKSYYTGILFERRAKFHYRQDTPGSDAVAYDWFTKAMNAFVKDNLTVLNERRQTAIKHFLKIPGLHLPYDPLGAFYLFPSCKSTGLNGYDFATKVLNEAGVIVIPGDNFGKSFSDYIRISYSSAPSNRLLEAASRIKHLMET